MQELRKSAVRIRQAALVIAGVALIGAVATFAGEEFSRHVAGVEKWIRSQGVLGFVTFGCVFVLLSSLFVPESLLTAVAGALFGVVAGVLVAVAANLAAAALHYMIARRFAHDRIRGLAASTPKLRALLAAIDDGTLHLQFLLRLMPFNPATLNYVLGASGVRFSPYLLATVGFLPHIIVEAYAGTAARRFLDASVHGPLHWTEAIPILVGLIAAVAALVIISKRAAIALERHGRADDRQV